MTQATTQINSRYIDLILIEDIGQDAVVIQGNIIGIALTSGVVGQKVTVDTEGVKRLNANTSQALTIGDELYWDSDAQEVRADSGTNTTLIGTCLSDKEISGTEVDVKLHSFLIVGSSVNPENITASSVDTFTNKKIDANTPSTGNSITNIGASELKESFITDFPTVVTLSVDNEVLVNNGVNDTTSKASIASMLSLNAGNQETFTNKTIDANAIGNVITNIGFSEIESGIITDQTTIVALDLEDTVLVNDTSDNVLGNTTIHEIIDLGLTTASFITAFSTDTLTNKTINASSVGNIITNIGASEVEVGLIKDLNDANEISIADYFMIENVPTLGNSVLAKLSIASLFNTVFTISGTLTNKTINANSNSITNIGASEIGPGIITGQTVIAALNLTDSILALDTSGSVLGSVTIQQVVDLADASGVTANSTTTFINKAINAKDNDITNIGVSEVNPGIISDQTAITTLTTSDSILALDTSGSVLGKATIQQIVDLGSGSGITAGSTDVFTNKTIDANAIGNIITNIGASEIESGIISDQTAITTLTTSDSILALDTSGSVLGSVTIQQIVDLGSGSGSGITAGSTDVFTNKTIDANAIGNVITNIGASEVESGIISDQTEGVVVSTDRFLFSDDNDSGALKRDSVQGILDLAGDMFLASSQTITGAKTFNDSTLLLNGSTSGTSTLNAAAVAGTTTFTLPLISTTLIGTDTADILTNKTINGHSSTITNIGASEIESGIIFDQTAITTLTTSDSILALDASGSVLGKATIQQIVDLSSGGGGSVTASSVTTFTNKTINANATGNDITNIGASEIEPGIISDQTAITTLSVSDHVLVHDLSGTVLGKATIQQIIDLTTLSTVTPSSTNTFTNKTIDANATGNIITNIGSSEVKSDLISGQPETIDLFTADKLLYYDNSQDALKSITVANFEDRLHSRTATLTHKSIDTETNIITNIGASEIESGIITDQTADTIVVEDEILFADVSNANSLRKATVQDIVNLSTQSESVGSLKLIEQYTVENTTSTIEVINNITATYDDYVIEGYFNVTNAPGHNINLRLSSFIDGAPYRDFNRSFLFVRSSVFTNNQINNDTTTRAIVKNMEDPTVVDFTLHIKRPRPVGPTMIRGESACFLNSPNEIALASFIGYDTGASDTIQSLRFSISGSGGLWTGSLEIYGRVK